LRRLTQLRPPLQFAALPGGLFFNYVHARRQEIYVRRTVPDVHARRQEIYVRRIVPDVRLLRMGWPHGQDHEDRGGELSYITPSCSRIRRCVVEEAFSSPSTMA
jgi:hypothetical protein